MPYIDEKIFDSNFAVPYDFIFSIGPSCYCAEILRHHKLRDKSMPFDWLLQDETVAGKDGFRGKIDLIISKFEHFADSPDDFDYLYPTGKTASNHVVYNKKTGLHYHHDFPADKSIVEGFPEVKEKYKRRSERLLDSMDKANRILVVYMQDGWFLDRNKNYLPDDVIIENAGRLRKHYKDKTIDFLFIEDNAAENATLETKYDIKKIIVQNTGGGSPPAIAAGMCASGTIRN
jgi:hypothetical protein